MTADSRTLYRFAYLAIATALATIGLKLLAWRVTGSAGLLSDALESVVNLVAAVVALLALRWSTQPPDEDHAYGHEKAEYFSAGAEGTMILIAAGSIVFVAAGRLIDPVTVEGIGIGVAISGAASVLNLIVGVALVRAGREHRSVTLEADGRHLLADVWTSVGVIVGLGAVAVTGWDRLDPIVALIVAVNIGGTAVELLRRAAGGLLDSALSDEEQAAIGNVLDGFDSDTITFHALRTRRAGRRSFVSVHVLVPGEWTVASGHDLAEDVEERLREAVPGVTVFTHLEPLEDPVSYEDAQLDRGAPFER